VPYHIVIEVVYDQAKNNDSDSVSDNSLVDSDNPYTDALESSSPKKGGVVEKLKSFAQTSNKKVKNIELREIGNRFISKLPKKKFYMERKEGNEYCTESPLYQLDYNDDLAANLLIDDEEISLKAGSGKELTKSPALKGPDI